MITRKCSISTQTTTMDIFFTVLVSILVPVSLLLITRKRSPKNVPPGSLGVPVVGQSLSLLWAMRANTAEKWLEKRIRKYGPVSKMTLFGKPTVFIHGLAANKLVFGSDSGTVGNGQTRSIKMILGERNITELRGEDHRRVRGALVSFLKPESLKKYARKIDGEIREHLECHWRGKTQVKVLPLMKTLTFNIICSHLLGIPKGLERDEFLDNFLTMIAGMWSVPINLPFTRYNDSLKASARVRDKVRGLIHKKRIELEKNGASSRQDLITCMLSMHGEDKKEAVSEDEMLHNIIVVMVAGYDTSSVLITFVLRLLANNPSIYADVLKEQEEVAKSKAENEPLTWEDLARMKYTWRVALETLRAFPPIFGGFRKALKDIEFGGYTIPKGWQIFWAANLTHLDGNIFPEPSKFDPARFENQSTIPPYSFIAFGGGQRICPGYEFTRLETLITLHHLVTRFTWKLLSNDSFIRDPMPVPDQGLLLEIKPKK